MNFNFTISQLPTGPEDYRIATDIEGRLTLSTDSGEVIFDQPEILLVELAIFMKNWLNTGAGLSFDYESMNYEESPILAFNATDDRYTCGSVWLKGSSGVFDRSEIETAMLQYLKELSHCLRRDHQIDLDDYRGFSDAGA